MDRNKVCKACNGTGLLSDDEQWQYTCSVCKGDGVIEPGVRLEPKGPFNVDEMNRTLE